MIERARLNLRKVIRDLAGYPFPDNPYNPYAWIVGDPEIADGVWIGAFCLIDSLHDKLVIGQGTNVSSGAQILTHSTVKRCISERKYKEIDHAPTNIGDYCFIGTNAVVLMGAKIGDHSVIGAGAVVPQHMVIPSYSLVVGVPGEIVGTSRDYLDFQNEEE